MINYIKSVLIFIIVALIHSNCTGQKSNKNVQKEYSKILVPFLPGDCHQCNDGFYKNLKMLDAQKIDYSFLIPDNYSDDLDYIKKEYKLDGYKNQQFIFSSSLFDRYHIYEQAFVLQFGQDSNYIIYNNANSLIKDLDQLNEEETIALGNYKIKNSIANIIAKNKGQICFQNSIQTNAFEYIDLLNKQQVAKISFTEEQLFYNYLLHFKDSAIAKNKLNEIKKANDIPKKDVFDHFEFVNDSLFVSSYHTYIESIQDSMLSGFFTINIYKDGTYLSGRSISSERVPPGYSVIPKFHTYKNELYIELVKNKLETDKPNYFLAKFELENKAYQFKKMLDFEVPAIHNEIGYEYLELRFSGRYFMTSISNILYDLETGQSVKLNIPVNEKFEYAHLLNNCKGVNILIKDIDIQYPNLLISYFSKDEKGIVANNIVLNYNLQNKNIVGKIQMPMDHSRFLKPDLSRFGYFLWVPEKNNHYLNYKKFF